MKLRDFNRLPVGTRLRLVPWKEAIRRRNALGMPRLEKIGGVHKDKWNRWVDMEARDRKFRWTTRPEDQDGRLERCGNYIPYYALEVDTEPIDINEEN